MECGREGFDKNSSAYGIMRHANVRLGEEENVVPKTRLEVMFHLWKIEVGSPSSLNEFFGVVIEIEGEIENGGGHWRVINRNTRFVEMPTPRTM